MKFKYFILLLLLIFCGVLFFTNPDTQMHKNFIKEKFTVLLNEKIDQEIENLEDPRLKTLGNIGKGFFPVLGDKFIDELINAKVGRENYYLFSLTQIYYKDQWRPVGIGILDKIYLFPKVEDEFRKLDLKTEAAKYLIN